jgi:hypothetical protein
VGVPEDPVVVKLAGGGSAVFIPPYGDTVVRPVQEYCDALWQWLDLIVKLCTDNPAPAEGWDQYAQFRTIAAVAPDLKLAIRKSNYLWRRIYKGEPHRTVPCPVHKGRWSGCSFSGEGCDCMSDVNVTGWLPETHDEHQATDG